MTVLTRPILAAVCSLCLLLGGVPAWGQKFMPAEIVQAETITPEMNQRLLAVVDPPLFALSEPKKPEDATEARKQIQQFFLANQPSAAYLDALSTVLASRIQGAAEHKDPQVRVNAMIVLSLMVDAGSKKWIDQGLKDKNDAVKRWAMQALGKRILWWKSQGTGANIDDAIQQIVEIIDVAKPPHTIVVGAAMEGLTKVDTSKSREALVRLLNQRVALHAADPTLSYAPERATLETLTGILQFESPPAIRLITGLNRAMARYASLIPSQFQDNAIAKEHETDAKNMLMQCLQSMAQLSAAAGAAKPAPLNHRQAKDWIINDRWKQLKVMAEKDWATILTASPFNLKASDLKP